MNKLKMLFVIATMITLLGQQNIEAGRLRRFRHYQGDLAPKNIEIAGQKFPSAGSSATSPTK
ncbi:MAG: hypothetical protein R2788_20995 [Saprospiraceae bacterium]